MNIKPEAKKQKGTAKKKDVSLFSATRCGNKVRVEVNATTTDCILMLAYMVKNLSKNSGLSEKALLGVISDALDCQNRTKVVRRNPQDVLAEFLEAIFN